MPASTQRLIVNSFKMARVGGWPALVVSTSLLVRGIRGPDKWGVARLPFADFFLLTVRLYVCMYALFICMYVLFNVYKDSFRVSKETYCIQSIDDYIIAFSKHNGVRLRTCLRLTKGF